MCPRSSMDRMRACGARDAGSIPAGGKNFYRWGSKTEVRFLPCRIRHLTE